MSGKVKVSVTVASELVEAIDVLAGRGGRSAVFEAALGSWLRHHRKRSLEQDIEKYYRSIDVEGRAEDRAWARLGDESAADW